MNSLSKFIPAAIAIAAILIIAYKPAKPELPEFSQKTGHVAEAYIFAAQNQDKLIYLACYCGCAGMQHSDKLLSHKSLKDCYIKPDGSYEPHASECKLCNDITLEARDLLMTGYSLKDVRKILTLRLT